MRRSSALIGGLAGASALTVLHEVARRTDKDAPHIHKIGMQAVEKTLEAADAEVPDKEGLFFTALAGEIIANTLFFSKVSGGSHPMLRGAILGLGAGISAVLLPKKMGLKNRPTNRTSDTRRMTVAWYVVGGLVAGMTAMLLESARPRR